MNNLKKCRERKNFTVEEVSERIGISKTAIYNIESGANNPSIDNLIRLAELYNVSIDYLLGRTNFEDFTMQYEYLQNLDEDELYKELDFLGIDRWATKDGTIHSKLNGEWFVIVKDMR
mgnify:CR=1 FL=1